MSHLIRIDTVWHSVLDLRLELLFASLDMSKYKNGIVHARNLGMKGSRDDSIYFVGRFSYIFLQLL